MVDAGRQNEHITFVDSDTNPVIILATYVEETTSIQNKSDFFVFMQVSNRKLEEGELWRLSSSCRQEATYSWKKLLTLVS